MSGKLHIPVETFGPKRLYDGCNIFISVNNGGHDFTPRESVNLLHTSTA